MTSDFSSLPQHPVKGYFTNEKYSKICNIPKIFILTPLILIPKWPISRLKIWQNGTKSNIPKHLDKPLMTDIK